MNKRILTRRSFLSMTAGGVVASCLPGCNSATAQTKKATPVSSKLAGSQPNIVLIMADDIGAFDFSCYGGTIMQSTHIDHLAQTGVQFRTAYATSLCTPTRAMIMTGKYATRTGVYGNWGDWNVNQDQFYKHDNFLKILQQAGYQTAIAGKFDNYVEFGKDWGTFDKRTLDHCDVSCIWPRDTRFVPQGQKFAGETVQYGDHFDTSRYYQPLILQNGKYRPTTKDEYAPDIFTQFLSDFFKTSAGSDRPFFAYYSMVLPHGDPGLKDPNPRPPDPSKSMFEYVDVCVGRIVDALDEFGLRDNTVIIFTSDNGSGAPPRGKNTSAEPAFWVPLIVNCPARIPARGLVDEMASLADIFPTMADLADARYHQEIDGLSFLPVLEGKPGERDYVFSYIAGERIIRDRRWLWEQIHETRPGTFWDCGNITAGSSRTDPNKFYKNVTGSKAPEVLAARARFEKILKKYPAPSGVPFSWEARRAESFRRWEEKVGHKIKSYEKLDKK